MQAYSGFKNGRPATSHQIATDANIVQPTSPYSTNSYGHPPPPSPQRIFSAPAIGYTTTNLPSQAYPFYPPQTLPTWPSTVPCYDLNTVITYNGLSIPAPFKHQPPPQPQVPPPVRPNYGRNYRKSHNRNNSGYPGQHSQATLVASTPPVTSAFEATPIADHAQSIIVDGLNNSPAKADGTHVTPCDSNIAAAAAAAPPLVTHLPLYQTIYCPQPQPSSYIYGDSVANSTAEHQLSASHNRADFTPSTGKNSTHVSGRSHSTNNASECNGDASNLASTTVFNGGNHLPVNGPNVASNTANTSSGNNHQSGKPPRQRARNLNVLRRQGRNEQNNSSINDSSATQSTDDVGSNKQRGNKLSPFDLQPGSFPPLPGVPLAEESITSSVVPAPPQSPTSPDVPANGSTAVTGCLADVVKGKVPRKEQPRLSDNCSISLRPNSVNEAGHHSATINNNSSINSNSTTITTTTTTTNNTSTTTITPTTTNTNINNISINSNNSDNSVATVTSINSSNTGTCDANCEPASHSEPESIATGKSKPIGSVLSDFTSVEKSPEEVSIGQKSEIVTNEERSSQKMEFNGSKCNGHSVAESTHSKTEQSVSTPRNLSYCDVARKAREKMAQGTVPDQKPMQDAQHSCSNGNGNGNGNNVLTTQQANCATATATSYTISQKNVSQKHQVTSKFSYSLIHTFFY